MTTTRCFDGEHERQREIVFSVTYVLSVQYSCAVVSVFLLWQESFIASGKKKVLVVCLAGCAVVSVFGSGEKYVGFGCTYYYVLGVPYSCGVVLFFLVFAGNSFWCYVRT